jgi:ABC-type transporter Mla MlaB component
MIEVTADFTQNTTILHLHGNLNITTYRRLITHAQKLHKQGVQRLVLDMQDVCELTTSGLFALHTIACLFQNLKTLPNAYGWSPVQATTQELQAGWYSPVKLANISEAVQERLVAEELVPFFEVVEVTAVYNAATNIEEVILDLTPVPTQPQTSQVSRSFWQNLMLGIYGRLGLTI